MDYTVERPHESSSGIFESLEGPADTRGLGGTVGFPELDRLVLIHGLSLYYECSGTSGSFGDLSGRCKQDTARYPHSLPEKWRHKCRRHPSSGGLTVGRLAIALWQFTLDAGTNLAPEIQA